ncbi:hypothetical protein Mapa_002154 [Marchantia paleacea]|nr:hypothetical protein Mapa_002154 [Marchantia paleacea]
MAVERKLPDEQEDDVKEKLENFFENLSAVFFCATPHNGSKSIEDLAKKIPEDSRNQMLALMSVLGSAMSRINADFSLYRSGRGNDLKLPIFKTYGIVPQNLTSQRGFKRTMVVLEASARYDMDDYFSVSADHFEVCQPEGTWAASLTQVGEAVDEDVSKIRNLKR